MWTDDIRQLAFRTSQRRYDEDSTAGIVASPERDLLPIGRPVGTAEIPTMVVRELDGILAADELNI